MSKAPIIVVDLQTGMFDGVVAPPVHDADGLVARVCTILAWARRTGHAIAFIQQNSEPGDQLEPGKPGWFIWPALGKAPDEPSFGKNSENAFSNPELLNWVKGQGADEVIIIGAATDHCVVTTVRGALALGLSVTVAADAHSTGGDTAPAIIAAHNAAFADAGVRLLSTNELTG